MRVIGVGFGRTGTASLRSALDLLGFGPCYHMADVLGRPERVRAWHAAAQGPVADWSELFDGYAATTDWPGSAFWRELVAAYPAAKAILTVRDPQRWYDSMERTVLETWRRRRAAPDAVPPAMREFGPMIEAVINQRVFAGRAEDREYAVRAFERHVEDVRATVPADRLLVFEVAQGWAPLCEFLDVPVPDAPFPRENDSAAFGQRTGAVSRSG
jgi:hypothetical protein